MSVEINKSNYEEFYLDFLEGNLSGEVLLAFEAFLAENPELAVSDDDLVILESESAEEAYGSFDKLLLKKQVDISGLNENTVDYFLISSTEGLLSEKDQKILNNWLEKNPAFKRDAAIIAATKSEADLTVVFDDKESLKHKTRIIPMWWSGVAAAAAVLLFFVAFNWNAPGINQTTDPVAGNNGDSTEIPKVETDDSAETPVSNQSSDQPDAKTKQVKGKKSLPAETPQKMKKSDPVVRPLELRNVDLQNKKELAELSIPKVQTQAPQIVESSSTYASVDQMANPIKPVTKAISEKLDTPVDFRTAKANNKKGGGFYLKLGKLEVSHTSASMH